MEVVLKPPHTPTTPRPGRECAVAVGSGFDLAQAKGGQAIGLAPQSKRQPGYLGLLIISPQIYPPRAALLHVAFVPSASASTKPEDPCAQGGCCFSQGPAPEEGCVILVALELAARAPIDGESRSNCALPALPDYVDTCNVLGWGTLLRLTAMFWMAHPVGHHTRLLWIPEDPSVCKDGASHVRPGTLEGFPTSVIRACAIV